MARNKKVNRDANPDQNKTSGASGAGRQPTNEEQMKRRQSAPKPNAVDEFNRQQDINDEQMKMQQMVNDRLFGQPGGMNQLNPNNPMTAKAQKASMQGNDGGMNGVAGVNGGNGMAVDGFHALANPIGKEAVQKATQILQRYKQGKANLERRIVENEQWYKLRHWECMRGEREQVEPTSAWLFNSIANKHADAMDNFPSPNILPREAGDKSQAEMLTDILPVILDQNDFEKVYSEVWDYKLKSGTGVYGVYWDSSKLNGLGDIAVVKVDILNLFWQSGITDIQKSRNIFHVDLMDNDLLESMYPQLRNKLGSQTIDIAKYIYDDSVDTTEKSVVVDWYYKKNVNGKEVLHYCKFCNDEVLFATENDQRYAERGFYDHGKYPFIFDPLFSVEGTPAGFGYIDVGKSAQEYIDRGGKSIMQNMLANTRPRHFIRGDGSVNEEEYADMTKDLVHVNGNLGTDSIMPIQGKNLPEIYVSVINNKIDELKETTGNRDITTGGTTSGVTAASAIAAMQEASGKLSRDANKKAYRVFRELCLMLIELIRQFYDMPRCFRIIGDKGVQEFVQYSNAGIAPQAQGNDFGLDLGLRIPLFDVEVTAEKASPYSKMAQNELALQLFGLGFFNPQIADQALACLEMMDFDGKDEVMQRISMNGGMMQQMMMLAQMVDQAHGSNEIAMGIAQQYGLQMPGGSPEKPNLSANAKESSVTSNQRQRVSSLADPDR